NVLLFAASAALVYAVARALLPDRLQAVAAAALFTVLPPYPGYLFVAYPEVLVAFVFLAGLAVLLHARGPAGAGLVVFVLGGGALFGEPVLPALPLSLVRLPARLRGRASAPAGGATLLLLVLPLARDGAVPPNALSPRVGEEARRSDRPLATLA